MRPRRSRTRTARAPDKAKAAAGAAAGRRHDAGQAQHRLHDRPLRPDARTQEYAEIKRQLEATGLFKVSLSSTAWATYNPARVKDTYPIYQLGWFPDFVDGDNYLGPFISDNNFVHAHYCDQGEKNRPCDAEKTYCRC